MRRLLLALLFLLAACAPPPPAPAPFAGKEVSFAILQDYDKGESLTAIGNDFATMEELGFHEWRGSFGWDDYEPEPGHFDFDWLDRFVDLAARHHLRLHPYLDYTPTWAARSEGPTTNQWNHPPHNPEDWSRFAARMGMEMRRHPNVVSFEIYNEENASLWWDGSPQEYATLLRVGSEALRAADPGVKILFGGLVFPDLPWVHAACAAGAGPAFDVLPIHAYPETWLPAGTTVENYLDPAFFHAHFLPQIDEACGPKQIWINEAGFATVPGRTTERDQANWWARAAATFLADPRVTELGVYQLRDRPLGAPVIGESENHYLGLIRADGSRKLAFRTVQMLLRLLNVGELAVIDDEAQIDVATGEPGELHHHLFLRPDGSQVLFLWDRRGSPSVRVQLRHAAGHAVEYALDGSAVPVPFDAQRILEPLQLTAGDVRIFLFTPPGG